MKKTNQKGGVKTLASILVTASVLILLLLAGPANALSLGLSGVKENYIPGETLSFQAQVDILDNEVANIKTVSLFANDNSVCTITPNGSIISGCTGVKIELVSADINRGYNYGYNYFESTGNGNYEGYGYSYGYNGGLYGGKLVYNITIRATTAERIFNLDERNTVNLAIETRTVLGNQIMTSGKETFYYGIRNIDRPENRTNVTDPNVEGNRTGGNNTNPGNGTDGNSTDDGFTLQSLDDENGSGGSGGVILCQILPNLPEGQSILVKANKVNSYMTPGSYKGKCSPDDEVIDLLDFGEDNSLEANLLNDDNGGQNSGLARITGAVIGPDGRATPWGILFLLVLIGGVYALVIYANNKTARRK